MTQWHEVALGVALEVRHGFAFRGEYFRDDGDLIVLTPGNFFDGGGFKPKSGKEKFYDGPYPDEFLLEAGDVVVAMTEQVKGLLGSTATIPEDGHYLHNQRIGLLEVTDPEVLDLRFAYHLMNATVVRDQIQATATGAKIRHTAPTRIRDVRVRLPSVHIQRTIAGILDSIDDLIENNRRRTEVLEEMARAIYREWFVRFRYPGHESVPLVESPLGPIPDGWAVARLADVADITMGQSPKSEYYNSEGVGMPFHQGVTYFGPHFPTHRKYCTVPGRAAVEGDVLVSVRAPVGRLNLAPDDMVIGRGLAAVRSRTGNQGLLFGQMQEVFAEEDAMGGGTIFKAIGKKDLEGVSVLQPPEVLRHHADEMLTSSIETIRALTFSARNLASLRDLLLPKLATGQIDVSSLDLESLMEGSVG